MNRKCGKKACSILSTHTKIINVLKSFLLCCELIRSTHHAPLFLPTFGLIFPLSRFLESEASNLKIESLIKTFLITISQFLSLLMMEAARHTAIKRSRRIINKMVINYKVFATTALNTRDAKERSHLWTLSERFFTALKSETMMKKIFMQNESVLRWGTRVNCMN